ncbi:MAG TPA: 1,2-phenylacetyl-CoA epoxidase subunit PaaB [Bacteroidota bacterium]|nr:1,2-phenylacetyl-CoA epoxidase subunit PaaB [Bacteroidota bacterium]
MADTQWETYEVFHQSRRGEPHEHVGAVHAPDPQMALQLAREQFARRLTCVSLWVVRTKDIAMTDYQDEVFFAQGTDKSYRDPKAFEAPTKKGPDEH